MSLRQQLAAELQRLAGTLAPATVTVSDASGIRMQVEFTAVDSMSCSFAQIELFVPSLQQAAFDALRNWADNLARKLTYLLEQIGPLEYDPAAGQVLIRSAPPDKLPDGTQYYEIVLSSQSGGSHARGAAQARRRPGDDAPRHALTRPDGTRGSATASA
jgi:hypothetical protein